jgi:CshA-type fibril repeat protein
VGYGGTASATAASTRGGNGCVVIRYAVSSVDYYETFNYTGTNQSWTVPAGVASATVFLLGAGGGGASIAVGGKGGGGGFVRGNLAVTPGEIYDVIVGQAGGGVAAANLSGNTWRTPATFGGGGRGGSLLSITSGYASGGGRSAIRVSGSSNDLVTAGGGGGGGYSNVSVRSEGNGAPGGGLSGLTSGAPAGGGGTQIAGGAGGISGWGATYNGGSGVKFAGGDSNDEGGGGGGGWYGGGGGADINSTVALGAGGFGGGGGSSYVASLTGATTTPGRGRNPGGSINVQALGNSPDCATEAGYGGTNSTSVIDTLGGHGCIFVKYTFSSVDYFETYNYTGADQTWTVPAGVTSATFHVIGAGGGGAWKRPFNGAGGGYATGTLAVTAGASYTLIVGEAGGGVAGTVSGGCYYTPLTYGGGGKGGSCYGGVMNWGYASGGGRSAIRVSGGTDDIVTAGAGGGGSYGGAAGAGGGLTGGAGVVNAAGGGTQTAGGAGGYSINGFPGLAGARYLGGNSRDEGGGGGGGWHGGGGGGDNGGGGGGSSYLGTLAGASTTSGSGRTPGLVPPINTVAPVISGQTLIGVNLTATSGTWNTSAASTWQWQTSTDGVTFTNVSAETSTTIATTSDVYYRVVESRSNIMGTVSAVSNVIKVTAPVVVDCTPTANTFTHCKRYNFYGAVQTYTVPSDMPVGSTFSVELWGAGGGGVCCSYWSTDTGGGAGGYVKSKVVIQSANEVFSVVVGERGESRDTATGYGGGGAGGPSSSATSNPGSSGGGMSALFAGSGTSSPVLIAGGGGGGSPGHDTNAFAGGGGGVGSGGQGTNAMMSGRAGTSSGGGAAATTTTQCAVLATAGTQYTGGRGCGTTAAVSEGGGGGGGGWYGGGGGNHQTSSSGTQNGGGGGGSGYRDTGRTSLVTSTTGGQGARANNPAATSSDQYVTGIGAGGNGYAASAAAAVGGHGMIVIQWAVPPTARPDSASGAVATAITVSPATNDTAASGATLSASSVRLCGVSPVETLTDCTQTSVSIAGEGTYTVSNGVVTFTGAAGFVGTSTASYVIADSRGSKSRSTISVTTLPPPTLRADESAAQKGDTQAVRPLSNDSAAGGASLDASTLRLCGVSPVETAPSCTQTSITVANEGTYSVSGGVVTFAAHSAYTGTRVLGYVAGDSNAQSSSSTITFTALPPPAVSASADSLTVGYASTATFTPLANDSAGTVPSDYTTQGTVSLDTATLKLCGAGETLSTGCTKSSVVASGQGTWTLSAGSVSFVPLATFTGAATSVSYVVCNSVAGNWAPATPSTTCGSSTISATVSSPVAPSPAADVISGSIGQALSVTPLANDTGSGLSSARMKLCDTSETAPNCLSTVVIVPGEGTWTLDTGTGEVTFVPLASFAGVATPISYTGTDLVGQTYSSSMTATIQIPPSPTSSTDTATGAAGGDILVSPLLNDTGTGLSGSSLRLCGAVEVAPACTLTTRTVPGEGTWSIDPASSTIVFTPEGGFTGMVTPVSYSVSDILSRSSSSTVSVTVTAIAATSAPMITASSDTGSSGSDAVTRDATPDAGASGANTGDTVTMTATKGSTTVSCSYVVSPGIESCSLPALADGTWTLTSVRTDAQNNVSSTSSATSLVIDTVGPLPPSAPDLVTSSDTGASSTDNVTMDTTPEFSAQGTSAGDTVVIAAHNGSTTVTCAYDTVTDSSCSLPTLTDGTWNVTVTVTDQAGNTSEAGASLSLVIETTAESPAQGVPQAGATTTTTTTVPGVVSNTSTTVPVSTTVPPANGAGKEKAEPESPVSTTTTLPNSRIPYDSSGMEKIVDGSGSVAGMPKGGWVRTEKSASAFIITTSEGLRIEIAAKTNANKSARFNSRGMPLFEHDDLISIAGGGLQPSSPASTWLFSTPKQLGQLTIDADGAFAEEYPVGEDVHVGDHTAQLNGIAPDGTLRVVEVKVEIIANTPLTATEDATDPVDAPPATPLDPVDAIGLIASAMAMLTIRRAGRSRGASRSASRGKQVSSSPDFADPLVLSRTRRGEERQGDSDETAREDAGGEVASVSAGHGATDHDDREDLYGAPRFERVDSLLKRFAASIDRSFPMFARIVDDGAYLRAMLGGSWLSLPVVAVVLGVLAAFDTGFTMMIPSLALVIAIVTIGAFDALAGILFAVAFGVSQLVGGGFTSVDSVRGFLGIAVFVFAPALVASAVRPFRRSNSDEERTWNRSVDAVLVALFGAWAAGTMYSALPALTTYRPEHSDHIGTVELVVLIAIATRWLMENASRLLVPRRLRAVEVDEFDEPSSAQRVASSVVRAAVFAFVAVVFIGNNWALWLGTAMFLVPKVLDEFSGVLPNIPALHRFLPRNLFRVVFMLFVALWWGQLVSDRFGDSENMLLYAFVLMGIPGHVMGIADWFGRDSRGWSSSAVSKILGIATLVIGILLVRGYLFG